MPAIKTSPPKANNGAGKKSAGFAGFSHDETNKSNGTKPSTEPIPIVTITKQPAVKRIQTDRNSTSSKSSNADQKTIVGDLLDLEIKAELHTPTPIERNENNSNAFDANDTVEVKTAGISVRSDLKRPHVERSDDVTASIEMTVVYDNTSKIKPHENIPDCRNWDCDEVYTYFMGTTTAEYAQLFKENEIDGDALLLMKRDDVLNRFNLKLGPALRLYSHIISLQFKNNNPVLTWNEY